MCAFMQVYMGRIISVLVSVVGLSQAVCFPPSSISLSMPVWKNKAVQFNLQGFKLPFNRKADVLGVIWGVGEVTSWSGWPLKNGIPWTIHEHCILYFLSHFQSCHDGMMLLGLSAPPNPHCRQPEPLTCKDLLMSQWSCRHGRRAFCKNSRWSFDQTSIRSHYKMLFVCLLEAGSHMAHPTGAVSWMS